MMIRVLIIAIATVLATGVAAVSRAEVESVRHTLDVRLDPPARELTGSDVIDMKLEQQTALLFFLDKDADIDSLTLDGQEIDYEFRGGRLSVVLPEAKQSGSVRLAIQYRAVFDDSYEPEPFAMDNPGQGVTGTMTDEAVFLLGGSGWYPLIQSPDASMDLTVRAPAGIFAVTGGRAVEHQTWEGESVSRWEIERAAGPQALFAGRYVIEHESAGDATVSTYFLKRTARLSNRYLEAAKEHLEFFENLHGKYLFPKFAVVENFFPTGYGFPSFTLLGTRVIQLPFIPYTSLRHEIAHCWWGNGVFVDYEQGNWSEGVTTYVSEHLSKVRESPEAARTYRVRALTDYALLAAGENDFPLSEFYSRNSPASQAVGYGKAMFVFHMAEQRVGSENFWAALSDVYNRHQFERASWSDFRDALVRNSDWSVDEARAFFKQWIQRDGAPKLSVLGTDVKKAGGKWRTSITLGQEKPYFALDVPVAVTAGEEEATRAIRLEGAEALAEIETSAKPEILAVDPDAHVFRLLADEEIPPTVNSVKGSDRLAAVFSSALDDGLKDVFRRLLAGLNHRRIRIIDEEELSPGDLAGRDVLFFGFPSTGLGRAATGPMPMGVEVRAKSFDAGGNVNSNEADSAFIAFKDPAEPARIKAFFLFDKNLPIQIVERTARKITHYGNYGLLAFKETQNMAKDALRPGASPLRVRLGGGT